MKNIWIRILLSIILGGAIQEGLSIATGREFKSIFMFTAVTIFILVSVIVYLQSTIALQRKVDKQLEKNDELIDDLD